MYNRQLITHQYFLALTAFNPNKRVMPAAAKCGLVGDYSPTSVGDFSPSPQCPALSTILFCIETVP